MIKLIVAILLFLISLLVLFKAPTNFFWQVQVAVTEFPYIPALVSLLLLVVFFRSGSYRISALSFFAASFVIFCLPMIRIYGATSDLQQRLDSAFGKSVPEQPLEKPFSFFRMFSGKDDVKPQTVIYRKEPDRNLNFDFYPAQTGDNRPLVIVIHGGSWAGGESNQLPAINSYLAVRGFNVAAMTYHLAPLYKYPIQLEDVQHVLDYIRKKPEWKVNTKKVVLLGRSAGGQIALQRTYDHPDPAIKGVIAFYAPADMYWGAHIKTNKLVLDAGKVMSDYLGGSVKEIPGKYEQASAPPFVNASTVPTLLIHGPNDPMVSYHHSERLEKKLRQFHVPHLLLSLPCASHGFDYNFNGPDGQASTFAVERFLSAILN